MSIAWREDLATGFRTIDAQHRAIFDRINALLEACSQGKGKQEVGKVLSFLEEYVTTHFEHEERSMLQHGFQGYREHKKQHVELTRQVAEIRKMVEADGVGVHTVVQLNRLVVHSFVAHIRKTDTQLGSHITSRQVPA